MRIFQALGDAFHLLALVILPFEIWKTGSCLGISGKSQILHAIVCTTRYMDLLFFYISIYNTTMKLIFIFGTYMTVFLIYVTYSHTYDRDHDTFRVQFLVIPALALALLVNHDHYNIIEISWAFSVYLEAVAILPHLFLVAKTGEAKRFTSHYLWALKTYRGFYIANWIYRYYVEWHYDSIQVTAGVVQMIFYCDVFHLSRIEKGPKLPIDSQVKS
ncbi:ER lumen protein-retaining receptor-like [Athalia rosae]|uniref:ER lumen protein-retaining receptor-like n=1 Tax=Athalia rosae TaxID=37344 RepID=UPI00203374D3|nr:ER lumen protein-retaining receptor-like [Athalia rosae]XP_048506159.1 ER lumen protein-retaining receptor-like [Athalia rosae]